MLNEKKIRLMAKLSHFEEEEGKEALRINQYYEMDFVRLEAIKSMVSLTIAYILVVLMVVFYYSEELIAKALNINYKELGVKLLTAYLILLVIYVAVTVVVSKIRFYNAGKKMEKHTKDLRSLQKMYDKNEA